ncbi:hypothetical protein ABD87_15025 [Lysinibacillus sphaericus]|uniref:hypothetical protein n=1 Tax=Lysinibacillus sphaericus TaxID=1421 RepID=UPI0018CF6AF5|nr:hypothetical protein [Lysinibacillus sphaericus]MBG9730804.1 hypothetical protein [Lysinibacillus sphaericus]
MVNNIQLKTVLEHQLITSAKAAEILGISKQRLLKVVKSNDIEPIHQSSQGNLFMRSDIVKLKNGTIETRKKMPVLINDGSTKEAIGKIDEVISILGEITHIFVYFDSFDAILDGFYMVSEFDLSDLKSLKSARFIIRDINGDEAWFYNLNCGYGCEGTTGSQVVLEKLGIPEDKSIYVTDSEYAIVKYFKNEEGHFEVHKNKSDFTRQTECISTLYYHNGKIVCLQDDAKYLPYMNDKTKFLYEYSSIVPNPNNIILFNSRESAIKHGYFSKDFFGNDIVYQVILCDQLGRELWLCPSANDISTLKYQKNVNEILEFCGLDVKYEENKQKYSKVIMDWLNIKPKQVPVEVIEIDI